VTPSLEGPFGSIEAASSGIIFIPAYSLYSIFNGVAAIFLDFFTGEAPSSLDLQQNIIINFYLL